MSDEDLLLTAPSRHTASDFETVNETGNIASTTNFPYTTYGDNELSENTLRQSISVENEQIKWDMNYLEAAIFLEEGENNDKFSTHPRNKEALPAYLVAHNKWFHVLDFSAALLVMFLALCEKPAVSKLELSVGIHGSLEMFGLAVLGLELVLRVRWQGLKRFLQHRRTVIKCVMLLVMFIEAIVVLVRQQNHFRVTRALRPLFLLHSHYSRGVRRFFRQILQSLPPILDMMVLLLFFMLIFAILGYYLFSENEKSEYFRTIEGSFISLFVLLTTANYPDVMLPAYNASRFAAIFFIIYLTIELYFLMNLLLAVVYDTFSSIEKDKIRKLLLHKRAACQHAFKLLVSRQRPTHLSIRHFMGLLKYYRSGKSKQDSYLMFKTLNKSNTGRLSLDEFYNVYGLTAIKWKKKSPHLWSRGCRYPFDKIHAGIHWFASWKWFEWGMVVIIAANFLWILVEAIQASVAQVHNFQTTWYSIMFVAIYFVEAVIKIIGLSPLKYFTNGWNVFDFLVLVAAIVGLFGEYFDSSFFYICILRPFRLLRLFKVKRRYRDVLGTLFILIDRFISVGISLILLYYFFAIIGMECFSQFDLTNCCKNTSVEDYYRFDNETFFEGYYYLSNFDNILISGVTLFELTVVNNWFIIMEGYAAAVTQWSRIYFMMFYLVTMVVMTVVVAFILEAFLFRIQYRRQMHDDVDDHTIVKYDIILCTEEIEMCTATYPKWVSHYIKHPVDSPGHSTLYRGQRYRDKDDFSIQMYKDEVAEWIREEEDRRRQNAEALEQWQQNGIMDERHLFDDSILSINMNSHSLPADTNVVNRPV